ncbi:hypothetical protein L6R53_11085 [Myxococcota bacterium]|nr:hypothetical protein [Myxococcota bacterium]
MSHALQRVVVRLLHDPDLAEQVLAGRDLPELTAAEHALLRRTDPRAFRTDPYRRARLVTSLVEELPATAALACQGRPVGELDAFLSSPAFHGCIMERGSLVGSFHAWIRPRAGAVADLEAAVARARREQPRPPGGAHLQRAPGLLPVGLPEGTVARWQAVLAALGPRPLEALVRGVAVGPLPPEGEGQEWVLVEVRDGQAGLSFVGEELARLLLAAEAPTTLATLAAVAAGLGAGEEAQEVVAGLVADGSLVATG